MVATQETERRQFFPVDEFIARNRREGRPLSGRTATYDALRRGELPHIRIGRKILIPEDAFDLMLARQHSNRQEAVVA